MVELTHRGIQFAARLCASRSLPRLRQEPVRIQRNDPDPDRGSGGGPIVADEEGPEPPQHTEAPLATIAGLHLFGGA